MKKYAPIVLFVYNRPKHTKMVLDALSNAFCAGESDLYIYADGASDESKKDDIDNVRNIILDDEYKKRFKSIIYQISEINLGLEISIIKGVSEIIQQYGRIIVLEDDIVVSRDFLLFMNDALEKFESDKKVWSIASNTPNSWLIRNQKEDVLWTNRGDCWGWASWGDRWRSIDWDVKDFDKFINSKAEQRKLNGGGRDLSRMLLLQQKGLIHSWAIRWCYTQSKKGMITIFPKHAKSINIGLDGTGVNCGKIGNDEQIKMIEEEKWIMKYNLNNKILNRMNQSTHFYSYWREKLGAVWYILRNFDNVYVKVLKD